MKTMTLKVQICHWNSAVKQIVEKINGTET